MGSEMCIRDRRCADYILKDRDDVLKVFIYCDREIRRQRALAEYGEIEEYIDEFMHQTDKKRRIHYETFTNQKWGRRENYDLMLNSGALGIDSCVQLICDAAKRG